MKIVDRIIAPFIERITIFNQRLGLNIGGLKLV